MTKRNSPKPLPVSMPAFDPEFPARRIAELQEQERLGQESLRAIAAQEAEMAERKRQLEQVMLRISGAIQVLMEQCQPVGPQLVKESDPPVSDNPEV